MNLTPFGTVSLGELIMALKASTSREDAIVTFDFCYMYPRHVGSYRGYYDHLSLRCQNDNSSKFPVRVRDLIGILEQAVGATFEGYKGGEFTMNRDTPVWVDNYGECSSTAIVGVSPSGDPNAYHVILKTAHID